MPCIYKKTTGTRLILKYNIRYCTWTSGITDYRGQSSSGSTQVSKLKSYLPLPVERPRSTFLEGAPGRNGHVSACAIAELMAKLHCREVQRLPPPMHLQHVSLPSHHGGPHEPERNVGYKTGIHCNFLGPNQWDPKVWYL